MDHNVVDIQLLDVGRSDVLDSNLQFRIPALFILVFSNGVGVDDDEVRTGNAMILGPYGETLAETWKARDEMVTADLDPELLKASTGRRWIQSRRPDLYGPLAEATGKEKDTRTVRFTRAE